MGRPGLRGAAVTYTMRVAWRAFVRYIDRKREGRLHEEEEVLEELKTAEKELLREQVRRRRSPRG